MVKEKNDYILIDFTGLIKAMFNSLWFLIAVGVLGAVLTYAVGYIYTSNIQYTPMYSSTVKLYSTSAYSSASRTASTQMNDYYEIMRTRRVANQVISDFNLNMTYREFTGQISRSMVTDTNMMYITVMFPNAEVGKEILDDLITVTSAYALEIMGTIPVEVYDEAQVAERPSNVPVLPTKKLLVFGFAGSFLLAFLIVLFLFLSDNKVRTSEDVKAESKLDVLSAVLDKKNKKSPGINKASMQSLYGELRMIKPDAKTICFYTFSDENKGSVIKDYLSFLTEAGKKAVYLDTEITNPKWGIEVSEESKNSLNDYLEGKVNDIAKITSKDDGGNYIKPVQANNTIELLTGNSFDTLIDKLRSEYDVILVDTAPFAYSAEAKVIRGKFDVTIVVAQLGKTKREDCASLSNSFKENELDGVIVTNVKGNIKKKAFKREYGRFMGLY